MKKYAILAKYSISEGQAKRFYLGGTADRIARKSLIHNRIFKKVAIPLCSAAS